MMLKTLVRVRLAALKGSLAVSVGGKAPTKGKIIGITLLFVYTFAAAGLGMWRIFQVLSEPFRTLGAEWAYFAMAALFSFGLMLIGSVFFAKAQLFEAKDNDLLMSMPISGGDIYLSRMVLLLVIAAVFDLPVVIPAMIVWLDAAGAGIWLVYYWAVFIALIFFALAVSSLLGLAISCIVSLVRRKALVGTVMCIAVLGAYTLLIVRLNTTVMDSVMTEKMAEMIGGFAPLYWLGRAVSDSSGPSLALCLLFLLGTSGAAYYILSVCYIRVATQKRGSAKIEYNGRIGKQQSAEKALLRKEFARLGSSSGYMVNAGLGVIFTLVGAVMLFIKRDAVNGLGETMPGLRALMPYLLAFGLCNMLSMCSFSAPSVSLEGKSLWIVRSIPVETGRILAAKLKVHLYICVPTSVISSLLCIYAVKPGLAGCAAILILPLIFTVFTALLGLAENLRYPKFDWINETQAVKSGIALLFTLLISWGVLIAAAAVFFLLNGNNIGLIAAGFGVAVLLASVLIYRWIMSRGCEIFDSL